MGTPACRRCGRCCDTDLNAWVTDADRARWVREGRYDILHLLANERAVWAGDRLVSTRTERPLGPCLFLTWEGPLAACAICETRPVVCRAYVPTSSPLCARWRG
jgi:Fe-S-cluster containining protein